MTRLYSILPVLRGFFLALVIVFLAAESGLRYGIGEYLTLDLSLVEVYPEHDFSRTSTDLIGIDEELEKFGDDLKSLIQGKSDDLEKALFIKEWVMNQASKVGAGIEAGTPYGMLVEMREGRAALCGDMAVVYLAALKSVGIEARLVHLVRSIYNDPDTHAVVEVLIGENWVVIDPTFNCYFMIGSTMASAMELRNLLLRNEQPKNLVVVYGDDVSYPAELQTYYLDPLVLYNNVFVVKRLNYETTKWFMLPWYGYYRGPLYVMADTDGSVAPSEIKIQQYLVAAYSFVFPVGFAVSLIAFVATLFIRVRRDQNCDYQSKGQVDD